MGVRSADRPTRVTDPTEKWAEGEGKMEGEREREIERERKKERKKERKRERQTETERGEIMVTSHFRGYNFFLILIKFHLITFL